MLRTRLKRSLPRSYLLPVLLGLFAFIANFFFLSSTGKTEEIAILTQKVPSGGQITPDKIKYVLASGEQPFLDLFLTPPQIEKGGPYTALTSLEKGTPVSRKSVTPEGHYKAKNPDSVGFLDVRPYIAAVLEPGSRIDVVSHSRDPSVPDLVLRGLLVVGAGNNPDKGGGFTSGPSREVPIAVGVAPGKQSDFTEIRERPYEVFLSAEVPPKKPTGKKTPPKKEDATPSNPPEESDEKINGETGGEK